MCNSCRKWRYCVFARHQHLLFLNAIAEKERVITELCSWFPLRCGSNLHRRAPLRHLLSCGILLICHILFGFVKRMCAREKISTSLGFLARCLCNRRRRLKAFSQSNFSVIEAYRFIVGQVISLCEQCDWWHFRMASAWYWCYKAVQASGKCCLIGGRGELEIFNRRCSFYCKSLSSWSVEWKKFRIEVFAWPKNWNQAWKIWHLGFSVEELGVPPTVSVHEAEVAVSECSQSWGLFTPTEFLGL